MTDLAGQHCVPCEGGVDPISKEDAIEMMKQVPGWILSSDGKTISRDFSFNDFAEAMRFVNRIAELAEREGHHPDITIRWNKVHFDLSTHAIGGLSTNDFVLAAKINTL